MSGRKVLINAGGVVTGTLQTPFVDADSIVVNGAEIEYVGSSRGVSLSENDSLIDLRGNVVVPGLIDSHSHPVVGDFSPRQNVWGWTQRALHGGVTSLISAGEVHWPNRKKDGKEAVAIAAAAYLTSRQRAPQSARVHGGALLLDRGVTESQIDYLHELGVRSLGEVGLGSEKDLAKIVRLVDYAKSLGWAVPLHFGGASVPGSSVIDADYALRIQPTTISHINGGPTSRSLDEILELIQNIDCHIEVVFAGNQTVATEVVQNLAAQQRLERLQFGTDTPSGTGAVPIAMLRLLTECASSSGVNPASLICCASGETAKKYKLAHEGEVGVGKLANLVVLAEPEGGPSNNALEAMQIGNTPAVAMTMVEGIIELTKSSVTPPPARPILSAAASLIG